MLKSSDHVRDTKTGFLGPGWGIGREHWDGIRVALAAERRMHGPDEAFPAKGM